MAEAIGELDEALEIHAQAERALPQAKCLHLSATVCRVQGELDAAEDRARRGEALAPAATPTLVAAIMEQGEVAVLRGKFADAADHYQRALVQGRAAGLLPDEQARLLRKRGKMLSAGGRHDEAAADIREARTLHETTGTADEARRASVELAVVLEQAGAGDQALATIDEALADARAAADHHVAADLELLAAGRAVAAGALDDALECARRARIHALDTIAPLSYVSAVITISEITNALGDRDAAYEALATGWVTTADVLGDPAAKQLFEPRLRALSEAWGEEAFAQVREAHDERRRAALRGDPPDPS